MDFLDEIIAEQSLLVGKPIQENITIIPRKPLDPLHKHRKYSEGLHERNLEHFHQAIEQVLISAFNLNPKTDLAQLKRQLNYAIDATFAEAERLQTNSPFSNKQ